MLSVAEEKQTRNIHVSVYNGRKSLLIKTKIARIYEYPWLDQLLLQSFEPNNFVRVFALHIDNFWKFTNAAPL